MAAQGSDLHLARCELGHARTGDASERLRASLPRAGGVGRAWRGRRCAPRHSAAALSRVLIAVILLLSAACTAAPPLEVVVLVSLPSGAAEYRAAADAAVYVANNDVATNSSVRLRAAHVLSGGVPLQTLENICTCADTARAAAVLGPQYSRDAVLAAALGALDTLPVVSFSATAPELGSEANYPTFVRLVPSDAVVAAAAVALLRGFGVRRCALLHQLDAFGSGGAEAVAAAATASGALDVVVRMGFDGAAGLGGLARAFRAVQAASARYVVVWCVDDVCGGVLAAAQAAGLLTPQYVWVFTAEPDVSAYAPACAASIISVIPARGGRGAGGAALRDRFRVAWASLSPSTLPPTASVYDDYLFDAVRTIQYAAVSAVAGGWVPAVSPLNVSCYSAARSGTALPVAYMRGVPLSGITGVIEFAARSCERTTSSVDVGMYAKVGGFVLIATSTGGVQSPPAPAVMWAGGSVKPPFDRDVLKGKVLRALTVLGPPFVFVGAGGVMSGIVPDTMNAIAEVLGFSLVWTVYSNLTHDKMLQEVNRSHFDCFLARAFITGCVRVSTIANAFGLVFVCFGLVWVSGDDCGRAVPLTARGAARGVRWSIFRLRTTQISIVSARMLTCTAIA